MDKKVCKRTTTRYNYVYSQEQEQWVVSNQFISDEQEFDVLGNLIVDRSFVADGEISEMNKYRYNEKNLLVEELIYFDANELAETHCYEYGDDNKLSKELVIYQDGTEDIITYKFNSDGMLLQKTQQDSDGEIEHREVYEYSGELLLKQEVYGLGGNMISKTNNTFDEKGNLIESVIWNQEDGNEGRVVHEYDEKGNRECSERYNAAGQIEARTSFTFDEKGNVTKLEEEDTTGSRHTKFENDEKGNAVFQEEYNDKEELNHRIERTYNEDGELIETIIYIDRHDQGPDQYYAVKHEFEYYS